MDRKANKAKEKVTDNNNDALLKRLLRILDSDLQRLTANIDETLKSRWVGKDKKAMSEIIKAILSITTHQEKQVLTNMVFLDKTEQRLANLEKIVQDITKKADVDLSNIRSRLDMLNKTIKRPVFSHIDRYLKEWEKLKKKRDKWLQDNR